MEFKSNAIPMPALGVSYKGQKKIVVPDQSLSLKEILTRFTRGEAVPVGHAVTHDEDTDVDLEKMRYADLVDRAEYVDSLKEVKRKFEEQEAKKKKAEAERAKAIAKAEEEKRIRIAAKKYAKQSSGGAV